MPTLTLSTATVSFGTVAVGATGTGSVTLTSSGTAPLVLSAGTVSGTGFTISGVSFPLTLNPGQTATLTVSFAPTAAGAVSGAVTLTSNSSTGTSTTITLSGTGQPVLSGLSCTSGSMTGAGTDACTVTLNAAAGTGGQAVSLSSNNSGGDGAVVGNGGCGSHQRQLHGHGLGGEHIGDGDADGVVGRRDPDLRHQPGVGGADAHPEHGHGELRDGGGGRDRNRVGDADFIGHSCAGPQRGDGERNRFYDFRRELPADPESWSDGHADGGLRSDRGGRGERRSDADQQLVDGNQHHHQPERDGAAGAERAQLHERVDDRRRDGHLHGDAERGGGHGRPGGEPVEQQRAVTVPSSVTVAAGATSASFYGHGLGGEHAADRDPDGHRREARPRPTPSAWARRCPRSR